MNIIPSHPHKTNSSAEIRFFKKIQESFIGDNGYIAFHSLNLTRHQSKRFGEADFVILCKYGIFVFEVKGGGISFDSGLWYSIDRYKQKHHIQDPFRQAEGAMHAISKEVKEFSKLQNIPIGYAVVFPDVEWQQNSSEWDLQIICDSRKFRNCESWLKNLFQYWQSKPHNSYELTIENIKDFKQFLRPEFELVEPLHGSLERLENKAVKLTEDQYRYLDIVVSNQRVLCSGGAGTGKTFLAIELARRLASTEKQVVFVCKSSWLRFYLQSIIINEFVTISTIEGAAVDMRRSGLDRYDVLIVDEGQDLFEYTSIDILDTLLKGGLSDGEWYIFHDINNQSGLFVDTNPEVLQLLESYSPAKIPLITNCRNTLPIINKVKETLNLDMGAKGTGFGPEVQFLFESSNSATSLEKDLNNIIGNGASSGSITILSPYSYEESSVHLLPEKIKNQIINLDDYSIRTFPLRNISFSEIKNFKGLENEIIIIVDLMKPAKEKKCTNNVLHYVAMTRAKSLLHVLWKEN